MTTEERARSLRAEGKSLRQIGRELNIPLTRAYYIMGGKRAQPRNPLTPTQATIVRHAPHNGGCSTQSGLVPVSLPRIPTLHGVAA